MSVGDKLVRAAEKKLKVLFEKAGVDSSHGILHARKVLGNAESALESALKSTTRTITEERALGIRLAAL
mgnify:CR=1 FL=1